MASLKGKVYAFTGGASGIGLAAAKIVSRRGATVCIADVDPEAMCTAEEYFTQQQQQQKEGGEGVRFSITKVDVSRREEVDAFVEGVVAQFGRLDGACNSAGIIGRVHGLRDVADLEDEEWHKIIAVNLTGTMYCLRAQLRKVVDGGSIVNVSSIHGLHGYAKHGAYDASKHGIIGLTKAAAKENGHREVRVNAVAPGAIYTPLMEKSWKLHNRPSDAPFDDSAAFGRQGTSEECGNVIAFLLGPESRYVSGSVYSVDGAM